MIKKLKQKKQQLKSQCQTPAHFLSCEKSLVSPSQNKVKNYSIDKNGYPEQQTSKQLNHDYNLLKNDYSYYQEPILKGLSNFVNKISNQSLTVITDRQSFIKTPIQPGFKIKTYIIKQSSTFKKKMQPQFNLYLSKNKQHLISAKNHPLSHQIFKLSLSEGKDYTRKSQNFLATISCDSEMRNFWVHSPMQSQYKQQRQELSTLIQYKKSNKQRMQMFTYLYYQQDYILAVKKKIEKLDIKEVDFSQFLILEQNKQEINRGSKMGKRDCALVDQQGDDYQYLNFKQIDKNIYQLEIQHPLSILQGFACILTRFQACL